MDTRGKIMECSGLQPGTVVVSGNFDPLLAAHVEWLLLARAGAPALAVVVTDPVDPLLPAQARATLVAALAVVDQVFLAGASAPVPALRLEEREAALRTGFLARVRGPQN
jgi:bifunctional ADP-heptose synthase (sugar kinase/adenylyltransferase)